MEHYPYFEACAPVDGLLSDGLGVLLLTGEWGAPVAHSNDYEETGDRLQWLEMPSDNDDARAGGIDPMSGYKVPGSGMVTDFKGRQVARRFEVEDPMTFDPREIR